jgi:hypothetical protein
MPLEEAARYGEISMHKLNRYVEKGWLVPEGLLQFVYYRDVLRAANIAQEDFRTHAGKANPNYGKTKRETA